MRAPSAAHGFLDRDGTQQGRAAEHLKAGDRAHRRVAAGDDEMREVLTHIFGRQAASAKQRDDGIEVALLRPRNRHFTQQAALAGCSPTFILVSLPYIGALSSVWNDSHATPCGSMVQYLSLFA